MKKCLLYISIILIAASCNKDDAEVPALTGKDYFPTDSGRYWIYDVSSIKYGPTTTDTFYQRKEVIHQSYLYKNTLIYELYEFYRPDASYPWSDQPDSVWSFTTDANRITIKQSNVEYIRLTFPISNGNTWDGNAKNIANTDTYTTSNFGQAYTVNGVTYPATVNVVEEQSLNFVNKDYRNRIYAENVGMIYLKQEFLRYNTDPQNIGQYIIEYGNVIEEKLLSYGTP